MRSDARIALLAVGLIWRVRPVHYVKRASFRPVVCVGIAALESLVLARVRRNARRALLVNLQMSRGLRLAKIVKLGNMQSV